MISWVAQKAYWELAKSYKMQIFFACGFSRKVKTNTGTIPNFWTAFGNIFSKKYHTFIKGSTGFGSKTVHRQDNSPTRFLKTVHRQIWRQFTDTFEDSSSTLFYHVIDIWLQNKTDNCEEILMIYDLRWYVDIICWESDILFVWLMINRHTFDCYMKLYWCDPIANCTLFLWNSPPQIRLQFK